MASACIPERPAMEADTPQLFTPPRKFHCLSFPEYQGNHWREKALEFCPPEPLFRDLSLLKRTRAFDPRFYLERYPDVAALERDPAEHYLFHGAEEGRQPHPQLDPAWADKQFPKREGLPEPALLRFLFAARSGEGLPFPPAPVAGLNPLEYAGIDPLADPLPPVWLDMNTTRFHYEKGRQLLAFALAALEAGHPILTLRRGCFANPPRSAPCIWTLLRLPGVWSCAHPSAIPADAIRISDGGTSPTGWSGRTLSLVLEKEVSGGTPLPFPMHTSILLAGTHRFLELARRRRRRIPLLFSGRSPLAYRFTGMARRYGVLPRHRVLAGIKHSFRDRCDTTIGDDRHFQERTPEAPPIVLIDARQWSIIPPCWLDRLGYASFFLCPPGALHPLSHHLVEAMAVGTVPILEYDRILHPPLTDGINCLTFRDLNGLRETVERALAMGEEEWQKLHQGAIDYYERHLHYPRILGHHLAGDSPADKLSLPFLHR